MTRDIPSQNKIPNKAIVMTNLHIKSKLDFEEQFKDQWLQVETGRGVFRNNDSVCLDVMVCASVFISIPCVDAVLPS